MSNDSHLKDSKSDDSDSKGDSGSKNSNSPDN